MRGRTEAVRPQRREGSLPLMGILEAPVRGEQGEGFLDLWLRASAGEAFGQRAEASCPLRVVSPDPERGLSRPLPLWSVLEGLAGREEKLRPKHLPSLGTLGGPGQVQPHVGPFSAFGTMSRLGSCSEFPCTSPKGRVQAG